MMRVLGLVCVLLSAWSSEWRQDLERRIAEHRQEQVSMVLRDAAGEPVANRPVSLRMTRSGFHWGTAINRKGWAEESEDNQRYRQEVARLFNTVVMESGHKWAKQLQPEDAALTARAVAWAQDQGLAIRGHALLWGAIKYPVIPEPFRAALQEQEPGLEKEFGQAIDAHIASNAAAWRGQIYEWDVINEPISEQHIFRYLREERGNAVGMMAEWLRIARDAAPKADLFINDFGILAGNKRGKDRRYHQMAADLLAAGAPLTGIGFQCHHWHGNMQRKPADILEQLDRYAALDPDLDLVITEYDTTGGGWGDDVDAAQAAYLERFLMSIYAHPRVTGFLMWGFWDGRHWRGNAPLYRRDWNPKLGLAVYENLVFERWWTDVSGTTDDQGRIRLRAFHGEHVLQVDTQTRSLTIVPDQKQLELHFID